MLKSEARVVPDGAAGSAARPRRLPIALGHSPPSVAARRQDSAVPAKRSDGICSV